jgi:hypothetical protein
VAVAVGSDTAASATVIAGGVGAGAGGTVGGGVGVGVPADMRTPLRVKLVGVAGRPGVAWNPNDTD